MTEVELKQAIEAAAATPSAPESSRGLVGELLDALESGSVRAADRVGDGWRVNAWVKQGILLGFRIAEDRRESCGPFHFRDRDLFPAVPAPEGADVRIVPGGTTVRRGAYLGRSVVVMPPAYVNVGAYVGEGSMVDSHALVGSCAQIGRGVHLSAAVQIGGVLEPIGALPVVVEDDVFVGGGCGVYEGTRVRSGAVLAPGVVLTRAVPLFDLVHDRVLRAPEDGPLEVPEGAVVVSGYRRAEGALATSHGLGIQAPLIVKYRDGRTDAALTLEAALR